MLKFSALLPSSSPGHCSANAKFLVLIFDRKLSWQHSHKFFVFATDLLFVKIAINIRLD